MYTDTSKDHSDNSHLGTYLADVYRLLPALCELIIKGHWGVVKQLLRRGAQLEYKDGNNRTALSWAAEAGNKAIVKQLLEKGADPEAKDLNGQTPLFYAVGNIEVVKLLLENVSD